MSATGKSEAQAKKDLGLAKGGIFDRPAWRWFGEAGAEAVLPLTDQARSIDLLSQTPLWSTLAGMFGSSSLASGRPSGRQSIHIGTVNIPAMPSNDIDGLLGEPARRYPPARSDGMTQVILHANETGTVKSDQPSSIDLAMLRAGHWSGLVRNAYFVLEDGPAEVVPAGAHIDSATFYFQSDDGGGYTATLAGLIIFCDNTGRDFYETSWNNPLPAYGSSTAVSIYGVNNNYRSVSLTARVQALIDNAKTGVRTLKLYRNPNTNTGTYDGKYFDLTHSDHYLVINYTEPPAAPTIGAAERVSDTQATIGWTNAVTGGPYASINILRSTDGGDYVQIASGLAASATSYTDSTISLNHYYAYKAVGVNTAGSATSDASNTIYTTPAAPSTLVGHQDSLHDGAARLDRQRQQ